MLDQVECARNKLDDPIIMTWAIRRYEYAAAQRPDLARSMEAAWFGDANLRYWIEADDNDDILWSLFFHLPARLFAGLTPELLQRWPDWSDTLVRHATPILVENAPGDLLQLFAHHVENNFQDTSKTEAVIKALARLPEAKALKLLDDIASRLPELEDDGFARQSLLRAMLRSTARLKPGDLASLTRMCLGAGSSRASDVERLLQELCTALFGSSALRDNADCLLMDEDGLPFSTLQHLFTDGAPLAECDRILAQIEPWPDAKSLLEKHSAASTATKTALAVIEVIQSMDNVDKDDNDDALTYFALAAVLSAYERDEIDAGSLDLDETLDFLALDLSENRHAAQLTERLMSFDPGLVASAISERLPLLQEDWGGVYLARLTGDLRLEDTAPQLIDCLCEDGGDFICEAAEKALARIGRPAQLALIARWDELDGTGQIYGKGVLEQVGGEHACQFAIERFDELFRDDVEAWCTLAEGAPDERLVDLLQPEVRRKQSLIDESYYCLSILTGRQHADLDTVRTRVMEDRQRRLERRAAIDEGDVPHALSDSLSLVLECEKCGDANRYEVKNVVIGPVGDDDMGYYVGEEFQCASCGAWPDFDFTGEADMTLMAAFLLHAQAMTEAEDGCSGPLRTVQVNAQCQSRSAPEVMATFKAAAADFPDNVANHLRLGRLHYTLDRPHRARDSYARALEIEPDCLEAGLGLAHALDDTGEPQAAYARLSAMLARKDNWRFFRVDELGPKGLADDFVELYNKLQKAQSLVERPLKKLSKLQDHRKVGRNAPCPCGSGNKYKKCCGNAMSAALH